MLLKTAIDYQKIIRKFQFAIQTAIENNFKPAYGILQKFLIKLQPFLSQKQISEFNKQLNQLNSIPTQFINQITKEYIVLLSSLMSDIDYLLKNTTFFDIKRLFIENTHQKIEINQFLEQAAEKLMYYKKQQSKNFSVTDANDLTRLQLYLQQIAEETRILPTGFTELDKHLGGLELQRLTCVMAETGRGKSLFMLTVIFNLLTAAYERKLDNLLQTFNKKPAIVYVTNENTIEETLLRLAKPVYYYMTKKPMPCNNIDHVIKVYNKFISNNPIQLFILYTPQYSTDAYEIQSEINQIEVFNNVKTLLLVVDYADRLLPASVDLKSSPEWRTLGVIFDELKSVAISQNVAVLTASQIQRAAYNKEWGVDVVARSIQKIENSDVVLALRPEVDAVNTRQRLYKLVIQKARNAAARDVEIPIVLDLDALLFRDLNPNESADIISTFANDLSDVFDVITDESNVNNKQKKVKDINDSNNDNEFDRAVIFDPKEFLKGDDYI